MVEIKKAIAFITALVLVLSCIPALAAGEFSATLESKTVNPGKIFTVDFSLEENPGVAAAYFNIEFDEEVFDFVSVSDEGLLNDFLPSVSENGIWLSWEEATDNSASGKAAELKFACKKDAPEQDYEIKIVATQLFNAALEEVKCTLNNAKITVEKPRHNVFIDVETNADAFEIENMLELKVNGKVSEFTFSGNMIRFLADEGDLVELKFLPIGAEKEYVPVYSRKSASKIPLSYTDTVMFAAYGKQTEITVKYENEADISNLIVMQYVDSSGRKVVFDKFYADENVLERISNYPDVYGKEFDAFTVEGKRYYTAEDAFKAISDGTNEITVEYKLANNTFSGYTVKQNENMKVYSHGKELEGAVEPFTVVTFHADEKAGEFSYWEDSQGKIISYNKSYSVYVISDIDIHPVFGKESLDAIVNIVVADNVGKAVFVLDRSATEDVFVSEYGVLIAEFDTDELTLDDVGVTEQGKVFASTKYGTVNNGTYIVTKGNKHSLGGTYSEKGTMLSARGYVIYKDAGGVKHTLYSSTVKTFVE